MELSDLPPRKSKILWNSNKITLSKERRGIELQRSSTLDPTTSIRGQGKWAQSRLSFSNDLPDGVLHEELEAKDKSNRTKSWIKRLLLKSRPLTASKKAAENATSEGEPPVAQSMASMANTFGKQKSRDFEGFSNQLTPQIPDQPIRIKKSVRKGRQASKAQLDDHHHIEGPRLGSLLMRPIAPPTRLASTDVIILKPVSMKDSELTLGQSSFASTSSRLGSVMSSLSIAFHPPSPQRSQHSFFNLFTPRKSSGKVSPSAVRRETVKKSSDVATGPSSSTISGPIANSRSLDSLRKRSLSRPLPPRPPACTDSQKDAVSVLSLDQASLLTLRSTPTINTTLRRHTLASAELRSSKDLGIQKVLPRSLTQARPSVGLKLDATLERLKTDAEIQKRIQASHQKRLENKEFVEEVVRKTTRVKVRHLSEPERTPHPLSRLVSSPTDLFEMERQLELEKESRRVTSNRRSDRCWSTDPALQSGWTQSSGYFSVWTLFGSSGSIPTTTGKSSATPRSHTPQPLIELQDISIVPQEQLE